MLPRREFLKISGTSVVALSLGQLFADNVGKGENANAQASRPATGEGSDHPLMEVPFLWFNDKPATDPENRHVYAFFRRTIVLDAEVLDACLYVSAGT